MLVRRADVPRQDAWTSFGCVLRTRRCLRESFVPADGNAPETFVSAAAASINAAVDARFAPEADGIRGADSR